MKVLILYFCVKSVSIIVAYVFVQEHFGRLKGLNLAWVGDGNNIVHSLLMACPRLGINLRVATPKVGIIISYNVI